LRIAYRNLACQPVGFDEFSRQMSQEGLRTDSDRSADGKEITLTIRGRGASACPAPYPPISEMPAFDLRDLNGKRITAESLKDQVRVKSYPMMALFDADGRLLGTKRGGARDELEAANVGPQLARWTEGLLRKAKD
jgi:hypothetical protein